MLGIVFQSTNTNGRRLRNYCKKNYLNIIASIEQTHFSSGYDWDILDIALIRKLNNKINILAKTALNLEHLLVHLKI